MTCLEVILSVRMRLGVKVRLMVRFATSIRKNSVNFIFSLSMTYKGKDFFKNLSQLYKLVKLSSGLSTSAQILRAIFFVHFLIYVPMSGLSNFSPLLGKRFFLVKFRLKRLVVISILSKILYHRIQTIKAV